MTDPMHYCGKLRGRANFIYWHFELTRYFEAINLKNTLTTTTMDERSRLMAMELLRCFINPSELPLIAECRSPKEAISKLRATYYPNTLANHASIRSQIADTVHCGVGKSEEFLFKICFHYRELRLSGGVVDDREIMATILYKLAPEFGHLTSRLDDCRSVAQIASLVEEADREMVWKRALEQKKRRDRERKRLDPVGCASNRTRAHSKQLPAIKQSTF